MFDLWIRYIWVVGLAAALVFLLRGHRALRRSEQAESTEVAALVNRIAACMAAPWLVVAAGQFFARTPTFVAYLRPQDGEGFVLGFYGTVLASVLGVAVWITTDAGAAALTLLCRTGVVSWRETWINRRGLRWVAVVLPIAVLA